MEKETIVKDMMKRLIHLGVFTFVTFQIISVTAQLPT
jgi:hypothetical protein